MTTRVETPLLHKTREFLTAWADQLETASQEKYSKIVKRNSLHLSTSGFVSYVDAGSEVWLGLNYNKATQRSRPTLIRSKAQATIDLWTDLNRNEKAEAKKEICAWIKLSAFVDNNSDDLEFCAYICFDDYGRDSIPWLEHMGGKPSQTNPAEQDFEAKTCLRNYNSEGLILDGCVIKGSIEYWLSDQEKKALKHLKAI